MRVMVSLVFFTVVALSGCQDSSTAHPVTPVPTAAFRELLCKDALQQRQAFLKSLTPAVAGAMGAMTSEELAAQVDMWNRWAERDSKWIPTAADYATMMRLTRNVESLCGR